MVIYDNAKQHELIDFPALIKSVRKALGETQAEFARRFASHANTVSRWESGKYQAPYEVISFVLRTEYEEKRNEKLKESRKFVVQVSLNNETEILPDDNPITQIFNSVFNDE